MCRNRTPFWISSVALLILGSQTWAQSDPSNGYGPDGGASMWPGLLAAHQEESWQPASLPMEPLPENVIAAECCLTPCCPAWQVSGDFLYLRPGRDGVPLAVPINGAIVPPPGTAPVQVGDTTTTDISFQPAFRAGLARWFDPCSAVEINYARFEGQTSAHAEANAPIVLRSLVAHPGTLDAPTDFLLADAGYDIRFQLADAAFRGVLVRGDQWVLTYLLGGRYAHLEQVFGSTFSNATLTENVDTRLWFDGGGIRFGLDGQRQFGCSGFSVYALGAASLLGGTFRGRFAEEQVPGIENPLVLTGWKDDRVFPILDAELGLGWMSEGGGVRLKAGYLFSGWFNTPTTDAFIRSVHAGRPGTLADTLTFDGLNARLEVVF